MIVPTVACLSNLNAAKRGARRNMGGLIGKRNGGNVVGLLIKDVTAF